MTPTARTRGSQRVGEEEKYRHGDTPRITYLPLPSSPPSPTRTLLCRFRRFFFSMPRRTPPNPSACRSVKLEMDNSGSSFHERANDGTQAPYRPRTPRTSPLKCCVFLSSSPLHVYSGYHRDAGSFQHSRELIFSMNNPSIPWLLRSAFRARKKNNKTVVSPQPSFQVKKHQTTKTDSQLWKFCKGFLVFRNKTPTSSVAPAPALGRPLFCKDQFVWFFLSRLCQDSAVGHQFFTRQPALTPLKSGAWT